MIFVIMNYGVTRNQAGRSWKAKAVFFTTASALSGLAVGLTLGLIGMVVPHGLKVPALVGLASTGAALGLWELLAKKVNVPQRNCETVQLWMNTGALTGAALNGAALGAGFVTRIGYWVWYAVPIAALLAGPLGGAVIFGAYGLIRGALPVLAILLILGRKRCDQKDITRAQEWLVRRSAVAKVAAQASLLAGAVFVGIVVLT